MSRSNIRWPTGHSEGAATGGAHGSRWERNPPRQFIGYPVAKSHPQQMSSGARQKCSAQNENAALLFRSTAIKIRQARFAAGLKVF